MNPENSGKKKNILSLTAENPEAGKLPANQIISCMHECQLSKDFFNQMQA